jgi:hypothetical protein
MQVPAESVGGALPLLQRYESVRSELEKVMVEREALRLEISQLKQEISKNAVPLVELETELTHPDRGYNIVVYYRLRAVWGLCNQKLMTLERDLHKKLEVADQENYKRQLQATWAAKRGTLSIRKTQVEKEKRIVFQSVSRLERMLRPGSILWRRANQNLEQNILAEKTKLRLLEREIESLDRELAMDAPDQLEESPGLSLNVRREINCAVVALAQHLYILFNEDNICDLALLANQKNLRTLSFGSLIECQNIDRKIRERLIHFRNQNLSIEELKKRTLWLKRKLVFSGQAAVPEPDCLNFIDTIFDEKDISAQPFYQPIPVNVLALNFWNIRDILCH